MARRATRNRFSAGGSPRRVAFLGGSTTTSTASDKLAQQAKDVRNQQTIDTYSDPIAKALKAAQNQSQLEKLTDPYVQKIDRLNRQLQEVQHNDALSKLASGDPESFLKSAADIIKGLPKNDQSRDSWLSLMEKANRKIVDDQWATEVKAGHKTLEQFLIHLNKELDSFPAGSPDAAATIKAITRTQSAMRARDESKNDQSAYLAFIKSGNIADYKEYLTNKLNRTTDPKATVDIHKQINALSEQQKKEDASKRLQSVAQAYTDYRDGKIGAAEAVVRLEKVLNDPKISSSEVEHIQSTVSGIYNVEQQRAQKAANAGKEAQAQELSKDLDYYNSLNTKISDAIKDGRVSDAKELLLDLQKAGAVVAAKYREIGSTSTSWETARSAENAAASVESSVLDVPNKIDSALLRGTDVSPAGRSRFAQELAAIPDPEDRLNAIMNRVNKVSAVADKLFTPQSQADAHNDVSALSNVALKDIRTLATKPRSLTPSEQAKQLEAFVEYRTRLGEINKERQIFNRDNPDKQIAMLPELGEGDFKIAVSGSSTPDQLKGVLGVAVAPDVFTRWQDVIGIPKTSTYDFQTGEFSGDNKSVEAAKKALDMSNKLYKTLNPGSPQPTNFELWQMAQGVINPTDVRTEVETRKHEDEQSLQWKALYKYLQLPGQSSGPKPASPTLNGLVTTEQADQEQGQNLGQMELPFDNPPTVFGADFQPDSGLMGGMDYTQPQLQDFTDQSQPFIMPPEAGAPDTGLMGGMDYAQQDPISGALDFLNQPTPVELPAFSLPEIPSFDPFAPAFDAGQTNNSQFNFDPHTQDENSVLALPPEQDYGSNGPY